MISVRNVSFRYRGRETFALAEINMEIPDGEFLGIIGPSGAGKSTLICALNGVIPRHYPGDFYGEALVEGYDSVESPGDAARSTGSVFQDIDGQISASVVEDEVLFGLENFGVPRDEIGGRMEEALAAAGISDLRERSVHSLSGGQKQKVIIAAVAALRPRIMLLDEPTGELDPASSRSVFEFLKRLNGEYGVTIVIVEQKIMLLCEFAKRLAMMEKGRLVLDGGVQEVLQKADVLENAGVNIPRVTTLARRLRSGGLYHGELPWNLNAAEKMMRGILSGHTAF
ncbi:MAG: ATP-binding cassette domain-containing protein [Treponema sp.]|jgi:energy-coupling factor transport system ATP-binding protein|nr:ATP-binding cassette domain-containing protein [Treponema sp.]